MPGALRRSKSHLLVALGLLLSGAGVVTLVTGMFGYCPACAIAGREPLKG